MKFSVNWLRQFVAIPDDAESLAKRLTLSGLEVASVESIGAGLDGVVVARILTCESHPNADRLHVCRVDAGGHGELQIVCGAPNARTGLVAPLATIGTKMPGGATIKAAKLRGVESSGMLCSARELGVDADASGLLELPGDAPLGAPLAEYLGLPDAVIEIELTPNRGDCLGMVGLADEVAAEFGTSAKALSVPAVTAALSAPRSIRLESGADCPRYLGRAVRGVDACARTPVWMLQRLRAAGVKPISAVVDITNYVMLELGQPMHAFDESKLAGDIVVRHAHAGESVKLLDGSEAHLGPEFMLIADDTKPLAVAGVMGGFESRVTAATRDVFLEAAHFAPPAIMGRARKLGLTTDAAFRFERGVDPELPRIAMERATALLLEIAGGQPGEVIEAVSPEYLPGHAAVGLRRDRITRVLGVAIGDAEVETILRGLGMDVTRQSDGWRVVAPTRRFDVAREEDLIEEVARIHGYAALPAGLPAGAPPAPRLDEGLPGSALAVRMAARGYHEAVCYSFVDPGLLHTWQMDQHTVPLANPLSADMAVMRPSLLPGLADALKRNRNRQQERVRLFERGAVFRAAETAGDAPVETAMLAAVACGEAAAEQWGEPKRALDFFDVKGDLGALLELGGNAERFTFDAADLPSWLHPGRGARVLCDGAPIGMLGALHPALQAQLDLPETCVFEVREDALRARAVPVARVLPHFPSLRRDIAIEVDDAVQWARIAAVIRAHAGKLVKRVLLFDCFRGPGLQTGRKSLAMGLILQDGSRTLTDQDADGCVADLVALLDRELGARLRN